MKTDGKHGQGTVEYLPRRMGRLEEIVLVETIFTMNICAEYRVTWNWEIIENLECESSLTELVL